MNNGLSLLNGSQRCVYYKNGTILLGINNSRYIYRSTDEGKLWLPSNPIFTWDGIVTDIKELNGVLYAATPDGVFISTNDGVFWTLLKASPLFSHCIHFIANKILVGTSGGELYETINGSQTFTLVNKFSKWVYSISNDKDFIYVATEGSGVFRRNITSGTWSQVNKSLVGLNATSIFASNGVILVSSNFRLHLSLDQGSNWKYVTDGWTYNAFSQINSILLAGSISDGVKLSYDNGNTWSAFNEGLTDLDVYSLGITDSHIIAGTWKNGVFFRPVKELIKCNLICQISSVILPCKGLFTATAMASTTNGTAPSNTNGTTIKPLKN
ncbi:MAG: hypothetical protein IPJ43_05950 [Saprospiraceae bacterium]|nr:hypothetical protein [Saprospiraceae bacterium]